MILTDGVHMMTDNKKDPEELHRFATKMGLKRCWFQTSTIHPHYDLTTLGKKELALRMGATLVSSRELVLRCSKFLTGGD
jgi:hypothetical protein